MTSLAIFSNCSLIMAVRSLFSLFCSNLPSYNYYNIIIKIYGIPDISTSLTLRFFCFRQTIILFNESGYKFYLNHLKHVRNVLSSAKDHLNSFNIFMLSVLIFNSNLVIFLFLEYDNNFLFSPKLYLLFILKGTSKEAKIMI